MRRNASRYFASPGVGEGELEFQREKTKPKKKKKKKERDGRMGRAKRGGEREQKRAKGNGPG